MALTDSNLIKIPLLFHQLSYLFKRFICVCMDMRVGLYKLSAEELMLLNCGVGEDT